MNHLINQTIDRYQIVELPGEGGMGAVYPARDLTLDRPVAFKMPHAELAVILRIQHVSAGEV